MLEGELASKLLIQAMRVLLHIILYMLTALYARSRQRALLHSPTCNANTVCGCLPDTTNLHAAFSSTANR
jgi:hypothetical protein